MFTCRPRVAPKTPLLPMRPGAPQLRGMLLPGALASLLGLAGVPASAQSLTGAMLFSTNSTGAASGGSFWNTRSGDFAFNLWLQQGGTFVNGPSDAQAGISVPLTPGVYTYSLYGEPGASTGFDGINLFFDNAAAPSLSAFGPTQTGATPSTFDDDGSPQTLALDTTSTPGAGALSFQQGGNTVTLTDFTWAVPTVFNTDQVSAFTATPSGADDFVGSLTLNVTGPAAAVPEPSPCALLAIGLLPVGLTLRARKRRQA